MGDGPRIVPRDMVAFNRRMADLEDAAAAAYASELSTVKDQRGRERLGRKIAHSKAQAAFHRQEVARLSRED